MEPMDLRPAYVFLGVVLMIASVVWLKALKHVGDLHGGGTLTQGSSNPGLHDGSPLGFQMLKEPVLRDRALPLPSNHMSPAAHSLLNMNRLDRSAVSVGTFEDQRREDYEYWMSRPARERFLGIEKLRLAYYGEDALRRFERVLEVSQRGES